MRLSLLLSYAAVIAGVGGCGGVQWHSRLDPGLKRAAALKQLVLVQFRTALTDDTDRTLFSNPEVIKALNDFQCVRLEYLLNKPLADEWGVTVVPTYLVLRPDGSLVDRRAGQMDPDNFRAFLKWAILRR